MRRLRYLISIFRGWLAVLVIAFVVSLLWEPRSTTAGDVKNVISDLFGGDGISLDPNISQFHAPHFSVDSSAALNDLSAAVASGANIFSFNSTVTGFTFDIQAGLPVRTKESLGPLLAERASTIGAGKWNVAITYTRADFQRFEGTDLDNLSLTFLHDDCCTSTTRAPPPDGILGPAGSFAAFELDTIEVDIDLELEQNIFAFFGTYGLTERWDAGIVVPIIYVRAKANAAATVVGISVIHAFGGAAPDAPTDTIEEDALGLGDVILRTKYNFSNSSSGASQQGWPDFAVIGQVSLPTGDEDDLLGSGEAQFQGLAVVSRQFDWFTPHLNLGYEVTTGSSEQDNLRYVAGFDAKLSSSVTTAYDVIGRWEPNGDDIGDHTVDIAIGAKWDPFDLVPLNVNFVVPVNKDSGLRTDFTWTIGLEYTF